MYSWGVRTNVTKNVVGKNKALLHCKTVNKKAELACSGREYAAHLPSGFVETLRPQEPLLKLYVS